MPSLREFAGEIEPHGSRVRSGPTNWLAHRRRIQRRKIRLDLRSGKRQQLPKRARTQPAICQHPLLIQPVHQVDQVVELALSRTSAVRPWVEPSLLLKARQATRAGVSAVEEKRSTTSISAGRFTST